MINSNTKPSRHHNFWRGGCSRGNCPREVVWIPWC